MKKYAICSGKRIKLALVGMEDISSPEPKKSLELTPSIAILLAGVLIAGAIVFVNLNPAQPAVVAGEPTSEVNVSPVTEADHLRGNAEAPIILIEYSDFQCPFCARIHPDLARIVDESNGGIAWVYRHLPLNSIHPEAMSAAIASECIAKQLGSEGFWQFADAIFADQDSMSAAAYVALAGRLGANVQEFSACTVSGEFDERIATHALEASQNGGTGTPFTVVVKGDLQVPVSGALPYAQLKAVINSVKNRQ